MQNFIEKHREKIVGFINGWDRIIFQGQLARGRFNAIDSMRYYLCSVRVLLKNFASHAKSMTKQLVEASESEARSLNRCFDTKESLSAIYPQLTWGSILGHCSREVMRFLGKRLDPRFQRELTSDYQDRFEGMRVKHHADVNSIKMYDKAQRILRVETTINNPRMFKVLRSKEGDDTQDLQWLRMRRGVADLYQRSQISLNNSTRTARRRGRREGHQRGPAIGFDFFERMD